MALRFIVPAYRERYRMEWAADLDAVPGKLNKLGWALGVLIAAPQVNKSLIPRPIVYEPDPRVASFIQQGIQFSKVAPETLKRQDFLTQEMGKRLQLSPIELEALQIGVYLHDLGKSEIPDAIVEKPSALSQEERRIMRGHTLVGGRHAQYKLIAPMPAVQVIVFHHERFDGTGFPLFARGEQIPLLARLFTVVDVYVALTEARPFKAAWSPERAWREIRLQSGRQFDPRMVELLYEVLSDTEWRRSTAAAS